MEVLFLVWNPGSISSFSPGPCSCRSEQEQTEGSHHRWANLQGMLKEICHHQKAGETRTSASLSQIHCTVVRRSWWQYYWKCVFCGVFHPPLIINSNAYLPLLQICLFPFFCWGERTIGGYWTSTSCVYVKSSRFLWYPSGYLLRVYWDIHQIISSFSRNLWH